MLKSNNAVKTSRSVKLFISGWTQTLWNAMGKTTNGYMKHSVKRTSEDKDRRPDKLEAGSNKKSRQYKANNQSIPVNVKRSSYMRSKA